MTDMGEEMTALGDTYIGRMISGVINFIRVDIWRIRLDDLPFKRTIFIRLLRVVILSIRGFDQDKCLLRASALTFYTLLSIPSVIAMLFGIAKGFGFEKRLEAALMENLPGQEEFASKVIAFSTSLLEQTKGGIIAGIGVAVLFWSVLKVLHHIESSLNDIWEIRESRSWGRKISDYLSVMLLAPVLILMSGSITVFITTQITEMTHKVPLLGYLSPLFSFSFQLIPYVLIWVLFTVIYVLMPNTRVSLKAGILGGIVAGTGYQIFQGIYLEFQIGVARYNAIYGSFAALPLFLMWVQITWWIVLFGAELSFATQNHATYEYEPGGLRVSPAFQKLLTLRVAHLVVHNFKDGQKPLTDTQISEALGIPIRLLHRILRDLVYSRLFIQTRTFVDGNYGYQPARDINNISIKNVIDDIDQNGVDNIPVVKTEELSSLSESLKQFSEAMEVSPANKLLKDI
jgi:membrane protein